ncbi:hypothetical protein SUGI_0973790 [Cryptomeria japonica]|nr:hypothetical protein SUGI_0973790 [Cryptomeria japonica]
MASTFYLAPVNELLARVLLSISETTAAAKDVTLEKESFKEFSLYIASLKPILEDLRARRVSIHSEALRMELESLHTQLQKACKVIQRYKTGSRLQLLLSCRKLLQQMQEITKEIGDCLAQLSLASLEISLDVRKKTNELGENMQNLEFKAAKKTEAIIQKIEEAIKEKQSNSQYISELLLQIANVTGTSLNPTFLEKELHDLRKEKEEMESRKKEAEALQLAQIIDFLYNSEMVSKSFSMSSRSSSRISDLNGSLSRNSSQDTGYQADEYSLKAFTCPLSKEIMEDPVDLVSGHTFDRQAISEYLCKGKRTCPVSGQELESFELKPNLALKNSIKEWKERNMENKLQHATSNITSKNSHEVNRALQDLDSLMEKPRNRVLIAEKGLIPTIVHALKTSGGSINTCIALKCLSYLAKDSDHNKEAIVNAGAINCAVNMLAQDEEADYAVSLLMELSRNSACSKKIGNANNCIPYLVALLNSRNPQTSQNAETVLENLSSNTKFVVRMTEANFFKPFIRLIAEGPIDTRVALATALSKMDPNSQSRKAFAQQSLVNSLVQMMSQSSPECRLASLHAILKLSKVPKITKRLLSADTVIPSLLQLITMPLDNHMKQIAAEILANLIEACKPSKFENSSKLLVLQSQQSISTFFDLVATVESATRVHLLRLLYGLAMKSVKVKAMIRCQSNAISTLVSFFEGQRPQVRLHALKLLFCLMEENASEIELTKHLKDVGMRNLVMIIASSPNEEERAAAAGILGRCPTSDPMLAEMLQKTEALNVIVEIISAKDLHIKKKMSGDSDALLENALGALLHFTSPSNFELQTCVAGLEILPLLVHILSTGSSLAKERAATALDAVEPLLNTVRETRSGAAEAALEALDTLLQEEIVDFGAQAIVESNGIPLILEVLERGTAPAKQKGIEVLEKIFPPSERSSPNSEMARKVLIELLQQGTPLMKKKAAAILNKMDILPTQSSYF